MLKRRYQILLVGSAILAAYFPIFFAGYSSIDDWGMIDSFAGIKEWHLWTFFTQYGNLYYRPLIGISFLFDKLLAGCNASFMHLENVLLHIVNALLVYLLARQVLPLQDRKTSILPLVAALLFGLHPINTESVNWISGRTDVLAGTFVLLSALSLMHFRQRRERSFLVLSWAALLCAAFVKETALAFLPGLMLIAFAERRQDEAPRREAIFVGENNLNVSLLLLLSAAVVAFTTFMLRSEAFISHQSRMAITLRFMSTDWMHTMFVFLRAFGFYMKKLVFPYPLNFAIMEVDPVYEIIAVPLVCLCIFLASRRTLAASFFLAGVLLISPAFVLAFNQIAWTPYAERYVYMASALFAVSAAGFASRVDRAAAIKTAKVAVPIILLVFFGTTLDRARIWQDDFLLSRDTVQKSPLSGSMRLVYGHMLAERGNYAEALKQLGEGKKIPSFGYDEGFDLNIGGIYEKQGQKAKAKEFYETAFKQSNGQSAEILKRLLKLLIEEKNSLHDDSRKKELNQDIFSYTLKLFKLNHDPHLLYQLGLISVELHQNVKALKYFQQASNNMPAEDPYRKMATDKIETVSRRMKQHHAKES